MIQINVNPFISKWFYYFLTNRIQNVRINDALSQSKCISTGAPQGCVSSPALFTLYTNDCTNSLPGNLFFKFSDDTAILSLLHQNSDPSLYFMEVNKFVQWCDNTYLIINTKKTKEMVLGPRSVGDHTPLSIHSEEIKQVTSFRYLGIHLDNLFTWNDHMDHVCSRLQQRLYFLRRLRLCFYSIRQ